MQIVVSVTVLLMDLSAAIMHVTVSVAINQLELSATLMQVTVSASMTIFILFMQVGVSVAIMQVDLFCIAQLFLLLNAGYCVCYSYASETFK